MGERARARAILGPGRSRSRLGLGWAVGRWGLGAGRWSTPAHVQTDAGVVDNTGRFTFGSGKHGRYSAAKWGSKQPEELEA